MNKMLLARNPFYIGLHMHFPLSYICISFFQFSFEKDDGAVNYFCVNLSGHGEPGYFIKHNSGCFCEGAFG